ncbi:MAG: threonine synthase [Bacteroidota bacterium]
MKFYSTRSPESLVSFREAVLEGLAPDGGLYVPTEIPALPESFWSQWKTLSAEELAVQVLAPFVREDIPEDALSELVKPVVSFHFPLVPVRSHIYSLELFHGPTLAFKDVGATFLAQALGYFARQQAQEYTVLVATSGDTGGAVANGFFGVEGTRVIILYPSGGVSPSQEKQLTTYGGNITALEVDGTFDDCQALVKQAFLNAELKKALNLTSANSINLARLLPQSLYYFLGLRQLDPMPEKLWVSVPSGNFGNLTAGLYAQRMGLPISRFVAATNANNVVPEYLQSAEYTPRPSVATISNAMDVGAPSNFERLKHLLPKHEDFTTAMEGSHFSDFMTLRVINTLHQRSQYLCDPHGVIGYLGLRQVMVGEPEAVGVFLETAHPAKFQERMPEGLQSEVEVPERLFAFLEREKVATQMSKDWESFRAYLEGLK